MLPFKSIRYGTADVLFGPMYEELTKRGVKFEFFREVTSLGVGPPATEGGQPVISEVRAHLRVSCPPTTPQVAQLGHGS